MTINLIQNIQNCLNTHYVEFWIDCLSCATANIYRIRSLVIRKWSIWTSSSSTCFVGHPLQKIVCLVLVYFVINLDLFLIIFLRAKILWKPVSPLLNPTLVHTLLRVEFLLNLPQTRSILRLYLDFSLDTLYDLTEVLLYHLWLLVSRSMKAVLMTWQ